MLHKAIAMPHNKCEDVIILYIQKIMIVFFTRKYLLRGYILGVLTHTTAWDQHWGGDEILKLVLVYIAWLLLS